MIDSCSPIGVYHFLRVVFFCLPCVRINEDRQQLVSYQGNADCMLRDSTSNTAAPACFTMSHAKVTKKERRACICYRRRIIIIISSVKIRPWQTYIVTRGWMKVTTCQVYLVEPPHHKYIGGKYETRKA